MEQPNYVPESAMAIVAHPDDIEYSCAGTLARWAKAGSKTFYVVCTSGDVGIAEAGMTKARAGEIRENEQRNAAAIAGAAEVVFLHEPDGMLQATLDLRKKLVREIRRLRPEVVITSDPTVVLASSDYINHPDHRAAGMAALDAVFPAAGQPNLFEELEAEGVKAHKVRRVFVTSWEKADYFINISETMDVKIAALKAHVSQMNGDDPAKMMREWAAETAKGKEMAYAEGFRVIQLVSDDDWAKKHGAVLP